jgi:hypothetical protein
MRITHEANVNNSGTIVGFPNEYSRMYEQKPLPDLEGNGLTHRSRVSSSGELQSKPNSA